MMTEPRFYIDHGMIHDRDTGKHVTTDGQPPFEDGIEGALTLLNNLENALRGSRGNYEGRHPNDRDEVLWAASEVQDLIDVVNELGIQNSETTPAEAVRELNAEIERLRAAVLAANDRPTYDELYSGEWEHPRVSDHG